MSVVQITHSGRAVTSFVRDTRDRWREQPVTSARWERTAASRDPFTGNTGRGLPDGVLDAAAHTPHYCGVPHLESPGGDRPVPLPADQPAMWWWPADPAASRRVTYSAPTDGDPWPASDATIRIRYDFPDGGAPIWHRHVAAALDLVADHRDTITVRELRKIINRNNSGDTPTR